MTKSNNRPSCPKCGMSMIATSPIRDSKQAFECLRCDYAEKRRIEEPASSR